MTLDLSKLRLPSWKTILGVTGWIIVGIVYPDAQILPHDWLPPATGADVPPAWLLGFVEWLMVIGVIDKIERKLPDK